MQFKKYFYRIIILISCFSVLSTSTKGQDLSFFGNPGLIHTPSAYLSNWGDLNVGMTHYPAATSFTFESGESAERSFWAHLGFLPFGEVSLKLTKPYNSRDKNYGIGDRSISFRLQVLKEKENRPAILIGVQDPFALQAFFNTNYIVLSKKRQIKQLELNVNLGYGFKIEETRGHILQGIFGGFQAKWRQIRFLTEYDAERINLGLGYQYKDWVRTNLGLIEGKYLSATLALSFSLK